MKLDKNDYIQKLFKEKLGELETPVNPQLWNAVASQIGTTTVATSTGMSLMTKLIIGISAASLVGVGAYYLSKEQTPQPHKEKTQLVENKEENTDKQESSSVIVNEKQQKATSPISQSEELKTPPTNVLHEEIPLNQQEKQATHNDFSDNKTFTNVPYPNLVGKKPDPIAEQPEVSTNQQAVIATPSTKKSESTNDAVTEVDVPSFQLTNLPNIYVLNAHGYFSIGYKGEYRDFQFTLLDNSNNVIYRSDNPNFEWRGTDLYNSLVKPGDYIYIITAVDQNGKAVNKYNTLTIINQ